MAEQPGNVYAPTDVHVEDVVVAGELDRADRSTRLAAAILDFLMMAAIGIVAAIFAPALTKGAGPTVGVIVGLAAAGIAFLVILALDIFFLYRDSQTIGKKIMNIKIVRTNGERIGLARIFFLRFLPITLAGLIPIIGSFVGIIDCLFIFRESRQCLHDTIADTIVVKV